MRNFTIIVLLLWSVCALGQEKHNATQINLSAITETVHSRNQPSGESMQAKQNPAPDSEKIYPLNPIVVTATRTERDPFSIPRDIVVIGHNQVDNNSIGFTPDALEDSPSILVQKTNYGGGAPVIRGLIGNQILILVDGVRLNNSTFRFGPNQYLNTISPSLIDRLEVVEGPGSVLYGSDALGGTVNLITLDARSFGLAGIRSVTRAASADRSISQHFDYRLGLGNVNILAGGGYQNFNDLSGGDGYQRPTGYNGYDGNVRVDYAADYSHSFSAVYQMTHLTDVPRTDKILSGDDLKYLFTPQQRELGYISYVGSLDWGFISKMNATLSINRQIEGREEITKKKPKTETRDRDEVQTLGATLEFHSPVYSNHLLTYGFEYYHDNVNSKRDTVNLPTGNSGATKPQFPDGATYETFGAFLQDEIDVNPFCVIPGIRYSAFKFNGKLDAPFGETTSTPNDVTFSLNLLYKLIPDRFNLIGGISEGFRAPNVDDISVFGKAGSGSGARFDTPSPDLEPEKSMNYETGFKYNGENSGLNMFYYDSFYKDLVVPKPALYNGQDSLNGLPVYKRVNVGEARIQGISINTYYQIASRIKLRGELSWTRGDNFSDNEPLSRIPPIRGIVGAVYNQDSYWLEYYNLFGGYQDRLSASDIKDFRIGANGTPGYVTFNLRGGYRLSPNFNFSLTFENIFDRLYKMHGSGVYSPGRNVIVSLIVNQ
jgi:hemoglobin/transferrin/lactoferrin receptor protein